MIANQAVRDRYFALLKAYVAQPEEKYLAAAADLGRELVLADCPTEEIVEIHEEALQHLAQESVDMTLLDAARLVSTPLVELLMAYGLAFREQQEFRRRAMDALQLYAEELQTVFDTIPLTLFVVDSDRRVRQANKAAQTFSDLPETEMIGRRTGTVLHCLHHLDVPEGCGFGPACQTCVLRNTILATFRTQQPAAGIEGNIAMQKGGEYVQRDVRIGTAFFESAAGPRVIVALEDITEHKRMQEELLKVEKLESVGVLAGGIAHDFNNILTGIMGNIGLAKMYAKPEGRVYQRLAEAERASMRAKDLTQQLLTFAKGGAPVRQAASIAGLIIDSAGFVVRGTNVRCDFSIPDDLWPVDLDEGQMSQVINNLVINAVQAMPEGGMIRVRAENVTVDEEQMPALKAGRYVQVTVEDQGIGISEEHLPKIFDPYFTTKQKGSGLGLAICYTIVKNHDGTITVDSELGEGATFHVYLPASRKEIPGRRVVEEVVLVGEGRILVMDDEQVVREVAAEMLRHLGYEAETARDGAEAIAKYKKAQEAGRPYDAVIMDLTVPGGLGGKEAIRQLHEIDPEAKAIVSSGYANDAVMANFRQYGFDGVVSKPYSIQELGGRLREVMGAAK